MSGMKRAFCIGLALGSLLLGGCHYSTNDDIQVADGSEHHGDEMTINGDVSVGRNAEAASSSFKTVNGSIRVEDGARVQDCATVNGTMEFGDGTETGDLKTVNGNLRLGRDARVKGRIQLVNGYVRLSPGSSVSGDIGTVNGMIEIRGTQVGGDLTNVNGGMLVTEGSVVEGDLIVREAGDDKHSKPPKIVIGPDSRIVGELRFERPVELYVHDSAKIGDVTGAEAVVFSGSEPG